MNSSNVVKQVEDNVINADKQHKVVDVINKVNLPVKSVYILLIHWG